jgi:multimeric flavodoxin WrbA
MTGEKADVGVVPEAAGVVGSDADEGSSVDMVVVEGNTPSPKVDTRPDILFISGSPKSRTCVALIELLEQGAKKAGAKTQTFLLSKKRINPCIGCGGCESTGNCVYANKTYKGGFLDDYLELKAVLERVDAVAIVAPVYFAGPPAQLKALYDRMQPYWVQRYLLGIPAKAKRPVQLFVVGGGGDSHGYAPLSGSTKSAMAVAGFNLEKVNNFIGFKDPRDMPKMPEGVEAESMTYAQLAQIKRQITQQKDLSQRALDAGGAFARFVVKKKQADELADQLEQVEAELEDLKKIGDSHENGALASGEDGAATTEGESDATTAAVPKRTRISSADLAASRDIEIATDDDEIKAYWRQSSLEFKDSFQAEIDQKYNELISQTPRKVIEEGDAAEAAAETTETVEADETVGTVETPPATPTETQEPPNAKADTES